VVGLGRKNVEIKKDQNKQYPCYSVKYKDRYPSNTGEYEQPRKDVLGGISGQRAFVRCCATESPE